MAGLDRRTGDYQFSKSHQITDHVEKDAVEGLISVVRVKYTTARDVDEKIVNLVLKKLKKPAIRCCTAEAPIVGGQIEQFE